MKLVEYTFGFAGLSLGLVLGALVMFARKEHIAHKLAVCEGATTDGFSPETVEVLDTWTLRIAGGRVTTSVILKTGKEVSCQVDLTPQEALRFAHALEIYASPTP